MQDKTILDDTVALMRDLRKRCEWDAEQTHHSLRPYLVEEACELDEAIALGDDRLMKEELGDVLLQVLFHSVLAEERGSFNIEDVATGLITKMRDRHPHLYGGGEKVPWEQMKARKRRSIDAGLPGSLPALHRAHRLQDRAGGVGFDWPDTDGPVQKVREELAEVVHSLSEFPVQFTPGGAPIVDSNHAAAEMELGDLLFACVNLCRKAGVHAALALEKSNRKFAHRFSRMEKLAEERGIDFPTAGLDALDSLWNDVKSEESQ